MPVVPTLDLENYLDFKTMTQYLKAVSTAAPHLVRVFSIGKSKQARPLLVAEVTNRNIREGRQKPGIWVDGGHEGWNLLGSMSCLELLRFLIEGHGRDEFLTELVDHSVFYIAPRLAPDEMEQCLVLGSICPQLQTTEGKRPQGGKQFRTLDPQGSWKPYKRDNRVLVPRNPEDRKGPFYELFHHVDETCMNNHGPWDFPSGEMQDRLLQAPSTKAVFEFMRSYDNVFGAISVGGAGDRIRLVSQGSEPLLSEGLGKRLSELSGLALEPQPRSNSRGGDFLSWASRNLGILAVDCRLWSLPRAASLERSDLSNPFHVDETEMLQVLRFCEKEFPEGSFSEWGEFQDPVLGAGEIGGWNWSKTWLNPPTGPYLARELKKLPRLALGLASAAPRISIESAEETVVGWSEDKKPLRLLSVQIGNRGYLPSCPTEAGPQVGATLKLDAKSNEILIGEAEQQVGDFAGSGLRRMNTALHSEARPAEELQRRFQAQFLIRGAENVGIAVSHPLAGVAEHLSKMPQGAMPGFTSTPAESTTSLVAESEESFEEAFPSFEDLDRDIVSLRASSPARTTPAPASVPGPTPATREDQTPEALPGIPTPPREAGFNIPDPPSSPSSPRSINFGSLDPSTAKDKSPFPGQSPSKGRVFGTPPQKPGGGIPGALAAQDGKSTSTGGSSKDTEFSPLPLLQSKGSGQEAGSTPFEPLSPVKKGASKQLEHPRPARKEPADQFEPLDPVAKTSEISSAETLGGSIPAPKPNKPKPEGERANPSAPPARLSRMSGPQLLRRQKGNSTGREPFKR